MRARGTQLPPAFTNASGDFVFANVPPDSYTIQVTMAGFKTLKRSGLTVSAGDRVGVGVLTIEVGGLTETVTVQAESPLVQTQSGERSFTVATKAVENLPISESQLRLAGLAGARRHRHLARRRSLLDRRRQQQRHDGRRLDDGHGQQLGAAADERRIDCGSESAGLELPGRNTAGRAASRSAP